MATQPQSLAVLALTGGGMLARFSSTILEQLQAWRSDSLGQLPGSHLSHAFDVMAGTSAGALCVAGLAVGLTPAEISSLLDEEGPKIFPRRRFGAKLRHLLGAKHRRAPLEAAVDRALGSRHNARLGEFEQLLVFPALDESAGVPVIFTNADEQHHDIRLRDAVLASASAPTYFAAHRINGNRYIDGGLFANAPDLAALAIAARQWRTLRFASTYLVSIGTTMQSSASPFAPDHPGAGGLYAWATRPPARILNLTMRSQVEHSLSLLPLLGLADHMRLDTLMPSGAHGPLELDDASDAARTALQNAALMALQALDPKRKGDLQSLVRRNRWTP